MILFLTVGFFWLLSGAIGATLILYVFWYLSDLVITEEDIIMAINLMIGGPATLILSIVGVMIYLLNYYNVRMPRIRIQPKKKS